MMQHIYSTYNAGILEMSNQGKKKTQRWMSNIQNIKNEPRNILLALTPQTCMSILQYIYVSNIFDLFHHAKGNMHHASSTILGSNFDIEVLDICESRN